ncbi:lytic polysaccharide monooxygenase [Streptomyces kunmingensis]|uniref:Lytic polysaccharide monooxygenase n=1 Tax=Streptomyces kunmingensis TaxID=68225 RepID=A0ABU6CLA1_9ACTN|nr:lytic polysaccharide monooxygenase [Streptomyces kunmingensis]MEB3965503.1 lytic polysaccharide monooxygenase [Streptomyces kunmingensis]
MTVPRLPRIAALAGALGLAAASVLALPGTATAHGVALTPGSRTYLCYKDLLAHSSTQMPANPACKAAVQAAGTTPLYNWFAVLDSNAGGRGAGYVADGKLCSAGDRSPYNFSPYNAARTDWPVTHLTSGATIQVKYSNWAHHPGSFHVYVTKQGFDPAQPLDWADLEKVQTVQNPPNNGGPGTEAGHYYWNLQLPQRTGRHIMFVQWVRSDSQENFFSCSDLAFDGGNGEVTGLSDQKQSATQVAAIGAGTANSQADAVHAGHHEHHAVTAAASDPQEDAASAIDHVGTLAATSAVALLGGTVLHLRMRKPRTDGR